MSLIMLVGLLMLPVVLSLVGYILIGLVNLNNLWQNAFFVGGTWYTPPEFESLGGKKAKKWKQSLQHLGKPLGDYIQPYIYSKARCSTWIECCRCIF